MTKVSSTVTATNAFKLICVRCACLQRSLGCLNSTRLLDSTGVSNYMLNGDAHSRPLRGEYDNFTLGHVL